MKKTTLILVCLVYLLTTIGFSITIHHCGDENSVQVLGINFNKHCSCDHENENHSTDCCYDKLIIIKGTKNDKTSNRIVSLKFNSVKQIAFIPTEKTTLFLINNRVFSTFKSESPHEHSPPIYLLDKTFLI